MPFISVPAAAERMDIDDMRRRFGDNDVLIAELFQLFLEGYLPQVAAIKAAVDARDLSAVRRSAHTFKGAASNLSATGVVGAAALLEEAADRGEMAAIDGLFATLDNEIEQLAAELRRLATTT